MDRKKIKRYIFLLSFLWFFLFVFLSRGRRKREGRKGQGREEKQSAYSKRHPCGSDSYRSL
jgi:hypothetical protein